MKCGEAKGIIQLYLDNELDSRCTMDVRHHLDSCVHCSRVLDIYSEQDKLLKQAALADTVDSGRLRGAILAHIENEAPWIGAKLWARPWLRRVAGLVIAAAIVAFLVMRGLLGPGAGHPAYADAIQDPVLLLTRIRSASLSQTIAD
jgi:anti-sigma factor RsiW